MEVLCPVSFFWATTCGALGSRWFLHRGLYWAKKTCETGSAREEKVWVNSSHGEEHLVPSASAPSTWVCAPLEGYCLLSLKPFPGQQWGGSLASGTLHGRLEMRDSFGIASCPAPEIQMTNGISGMRTLGDTSGFIGSWVWEQSLTWGVGPSPGLS